MIKQKQQQQQQHKRRWPCLFVWRIENIDSSQICFPYRWFFLVFSLSKLCKHEIKKVRWFRAVLMWRETFGKYIAFITPLLYYKRSRCADVLLIVMKILLIPIFCHATTSSPFTKLHQVYWDWLYLEYEQDGKYNFFTAICLMG